MSINYIDEISEAAWSDAIEVINTNKTFTITTHVNPDGDAIGSEYAVYQLLTSLGKTTRVINNNSYPVVYSFLPGIESIMELYSSKHDSWLTSCDVIVILDINHLDRLGHVFGPVARSKSKKICIDHHPGNELFGDLNLVLESACATSEIIFDLYLHFKISPSTDTAEALYAGIVTDTESFTNSHTTSRSFEIASWLVNYGVSPAKIHNILYQGYPWSRFKLLTSVYETVTRECDGQLIWMKVTAGMVESSGAMREEMDGFVDFPLSFKGVELTILFLEVPGKGTKISLRSHGRVNVSTLAKKFGGGGHRHASGIRMFETLLDNAIDSILTEARNCFA